MTTPNRTLVVVGTSDSSRSLDRSAVRYAAESTTDLVILSVIPIGEYRAQTGDITSVSDLDVDDTFDTAVEASRCTALRIGEQALADSDASFEAVGMVGDVQDCTLEIARKYGCDHITVPGHRRRLRDVLCGSDLPTSLERTFHGHVTVHYGSTPDDPAGTFEGEESAVSPDLID